MERVTGVHRGSDEEWSPSDAHYVYIYTAPDKARGRRAWILTTVVVVAFVVWLFASGPAGWIAAVVGVVAFVVRVSMTARSSGT